MQFIAVTVVVVFSIFIFWVGIIKIVFVPLSLLFEIVRRRKAKAPLSATPLVSVVVPGYNEERVMFYRRFADERFFYDGFGISAQAGL